MKTHCQDIHNTIITDEEMRFHCFYKIHGLEIELLNIYDSAGNKIELTFSREVQLSSKLISQLYVQTKKANEPV
jgi:hypothetical protein